MRKITRATRAVFLSCLCFYALSVILGLLEIEEVSWVIELLAQLIMVIPGLLIMLIHKEPVMDTLRIKKTRPVNFAMALVVLLVSYPVIMILNLFSMIFVDNVVTDAMPGFIAQHGYGMTFFIVAMLPALCEEFLFRGVLYNTYRKQYPVLAFLISAFAFGLMHGNLNQMPYAIYVGIIFALMLEATGSVLITAFMHFCINGFNVLLMFIQLPTAAGAAEESRTMILSVFANAKVMLGNYGVLWMLAFYIAIASVFFVISMLMVWLVFKMNKKDLFEYLFHGSPEYREMRNRQEKRDWPVDFWFIGFIVIMLIIFIFFR